MTKTKTKTSLFYYSWIVSLYLVVAFDVADVVTLAWHLHGVDCCLTAKPCNETAGSINTTAIGNGCRNALSILGSVIIERRTYPMGLRRWRLLRHSKNTVAVVDSDNTTLEEALFVSLVESHHAGCLFLYCITNEMLEGEVKDIVAGNDEVGGR